MIVTGSSVAFLVGSVITWRALALTGKFQNLSILLYIYTEVGVLKRKF